MTIDTQPTIEKATPTDLEALCLAQLWKLPCVFICENNAYAMGTSIERASYLTDMSLRAQGVGMLRDAFEGFDVDVVRERVGRAARYAREGKGPVLLEIQTYRYRGHSMSDPAKYRPKGELDNVREHSDCLMRTAQKLLDDFGYTEAELEKLRDEVDAQAQEAYDFAEQSPEPSTDKLYDYVYAPSQE